MPLIDDIRVDIGDDDGAIPSGVPTHNLLSTSHGDTTVGSPTNGSVVVGSSTSWSALPSGAEGESLMVKAGSLQWDTATAQATGLANGDLAGSYPNPLVVAISGATVDRPLTGQALIFDGTKYIGSGISAAGASSQTLSETLDFGNEANQTIFWASGLGPTTHLQGPSDEVFKLASASGQNMELFAGDTLRVFISPTGTQLINSVDINTVRDGEGDGTLRAGIVSANTNLTLGEIGSANSTRLVDGVNALHVERGDGATRNQVQASSFAAFSSIGGNSVAYINTNGMSVGHLLEFTFASNTIAANRDTFINRQDAGVVGFGASTGAKDGTVRAAQSRMSTGFKISSAGYFAAASGSDVDTDGNDTFLFRDTAAVWGMGSAVGTADGTLNLGALVFESATTSGIRLDLESGQLAVREGDDSAYGDFKAGLILARASTTSKVALSGPNAQAVLSSDAELCFRDGMNATVGSNDTFIGRTSAGAVYVGATTGTADGVLNCSGVNTISLSATNLSLPGYLNVGGLTTTSGGITSPGAGVNSEAFGFGCSAIGTQATAVGNNVHASSSSSVGLGYNFTLVGTNGVGVGVLASDVGTSTTLIGAGAAGVRFGTPTTQCVGIGTSAGCINTGGTAIGYVSQAAMYCTAIGYNAQADSSDYAIAIGRNTSGLGNYGIVIGDSSYSIGARAVALGVSALSNYSYSLALGFGAATSKANQLVIGGTVGYISEVVIGSSVSEATPIAETLWTTTNGVGTDIVATNLILQPGLGTGAATPSSFSVSTPSSGTTGTTQQTAATRLTINETLSDFTNTVSYVGSINTGKQVVNGANLADSYIVVDTEDHMVFVQASGATVVLNATPEQWETHIIKDAIGAAGTSPITIAGSGILIDGQSSIAISSDWASVTVAYNGTFWGVY